MRITTTTLSRALDALWLITIGLFLGLTAGLVLAVILTFKNAKAIKALPGSAPFNDARFIAYQHDAVAGFMGQDLFIVGGVAAMLLLGLALIAHTGHGLLVMTKLHAAEGSRRCSQIRSISLIFCLLCMVKGASLTMQMNRVWPDLYDLTASDTLLASRRAAFDAMHQRSEKVVGAAWLSGLLALGLTPWCRRIADTAIQSGDGKAKGKQEKNSA